MIFLNMQSNCEKCATTLSTLAICDNCPEKLMYRDNLSHKYFSRCRKGLLLVMALVNPLSTVKLRFFGAFVRGDRVSISMTLSRADFNPFFGPHSETHLRKPFCPFENIIACRGRKGVLLSTSWFTNLFALSVIMKLSLKVEILPRHRSAIN